jgi:uncharacterized membrane protein YtjA (UPF0391 family)
MAIACLRLFTVFHSGRFSKCRATCNSGRHPNVKSHHTQAKEIDMLGWILTFLVIALIAGALGFGGIAGASAGIAQILFYIFLVLLLVSLVMHLMRRA